MLASTSTSEEVEELPPESEKVIAFEVGYYGLWRESLSNLEFLYTIYPNGATNQTVYPKLDYGYAPGIRALGEVNIGPKNTIEAIYIGCFNWRDSGSAADQNSLMVSTRPFVTIDWARFSNFQYHYHAKLNSGELSYWRHMTPRYTDWFSFSWMLGARYIDLRDQLKMMIGTGSRTDNGHVKVVNQMWGGQGGLEFQVTAIPWLTWALQTKGGIFADLIKKKSLFKDLGNTAIPVSTTNKSVKPDYTLEFTPYIIGRLSPFYCRIAYNWMVLYNPVLAPSQVKLHKKVNHNYTHKHVYFQGFYVDVGFSW